MGTETTRAGSEAGRQRPSLIDSHCHLEAKDFGDEREAVIARARAAGVDELICVGSGSSLDEVQNAVALAESHPRIWAAIGIHPHEVARMPEGALAEIERLATSHPRVVAVGETGLDYHYDYSPRETQREALRAFIAIARRANKPLSFHLRDAHDDARRIFAEERVDEVGGVIHCFTGTLADAQAYVALGLHVSFSGVLTFKSAEAVREAAAWIPLERLLVETDCPYLAPVPLRGKRNEPAFVVHTAARLAELKGLPVEELARIASANTRRLFRLPDGAS
ncbi:MAG TPA: TatD family hydrolase [Polyangia bacterium]